MLYKHQTSTCPDLSGGAQYKSMYDISSSCAVRGIGAGWVAKLKHLNTGRLAHWLVTKSYLGTVRSAVASARNHHLTHFYTSESHMP